MDEQNPISDDYLIQAARRRLLRMLEQEGGGKDAASIVNNVYGGGGGGGGGGGFGGMLESMTGGGPSGGGEDPFDYFVDIKREDLPEINPATGKPMGWKKTVHRFRSESTPRGSYGKKKDLTYLPVDPMDPGVP